MVVGPSGEKAGGEQVREEGTVCEFRETEKVTLESPKAEREPRTLIAEGRTLRAGETADADPQRGGLLPARRSKRASVKAWPGRGPGSRTCGQSSWSNSGRGSEAVRRPLASAPE